MRSLAYGRNFEIGMTQQTSRPMQHHGRNFVTAAFGRHRSMRDRGERGHRTKQIAWRVARVGAQQRGPLPTPSPGPVSGRERSATQSTLPACQASAGPATSRSRPRSGGAGRDCLYRMAPVWSHGDKQVTTLGTLTAPTPVSCRNSIRCHQHRA